MKTKPSVARRKPVRKICRAPRSGGKCAKCGRGKLDYNGLVQLACSVCGYVAGSGGFS